MLHLVHRALTRILVGTPPNNFGAVSEPAASEMVIRHFHYDLWSDWFPVASAIRAPTAGTSGRTAGKSWRFSERFKPFC
jgi:hypothetical protein